MTGLRDIGGTGQTSLDAWKQDEHAVAFGAWDRFSTSRLVKLCDQFNECQLVRTLLGTQSCRSLSDVGCATGRFSRFFGKVWPGLEYKGFDISPAAVEHAKKSHGRGNFTVFDGNVKSLPEIRSDIVFCRDVVPHHNDPYAFLSDLYEVTNRYLILRIRTREVGATVLDVSQSCMYVYGHWIPYIVINTSELVDFLRSLNPRPANITLWRHPELLGGLNSRFLPKELYYPETEAAGTAVLIEKGTEEFNGDTVVNVETRPEASGQDLPKWVREMRKIARRIGI